MTQAILELRHTELLSFSYIAISHALPNISTRETNFVYKPSGLHHAQP